MAMNMLLKVTALLVELKLKRTIQFVSKIWFGRSGEPVDIDPRTLEITIFALGNFEIMLLMLD